MQIFSYHGCQKCLVKACCQNVCDAYRQHVSEVYDLTINIDEIPLRECEEFVATSHEPSEHIIEVKGQKVRVSIDVRGLF